MLFGDGEPSGDKWGLVGIFSVLFTGIGMIFQKLIDFRKAADAGEVEKIKAKQVSDQAVNEARMAEIERQAAHAKEEATTAKQEAAIAKQAMEKCEDNHRKMELDHAELRGQLMASRQDRESLRAMVVETIKLNAETQGQVNTVKTQVAQTHTAVNQVAAKQGELASDLGRTVEEIAMMKNGGSNPAHRDP